VVSQQLIPKVGGGRLLAMEVMIPNAAIRNLIREDKIHQIYSIMQTGQAKFGMQTLNQSLYELYVRKNISYEDCVGRSSNVDELIQMLGRSGLAASQTIPKDYR
jgi:twitching motility protein PilT